MWAASGGCLDTFEVHDEGVFSAVFSADGQQVLDDWAANVWSAASGECLVTLEGNDDSVSSAELLFMRFNR